MNDSDYKIKTKIDSGVITDAVLLRLHGLYKTPFLQIKPWQII